MRGLDGLYIVSADIVEVAPAYDTNAELTTMAAADVGARSFDFGCGFPDESSYLPPPLNILPDTVLTLAQTINVGPLRSPERDGEDALRKDCGCGC